jgi:biotin synthase-like enzyme
MSEETHALCLHAGASNNLLGDRLLTTDKNGDDADFSILDQLGVTVRSLDQKVAIRVARRFTPADRRRCWHAP